MMFSSTRMFFPDGRTRLLACVFAVACMAASARAGEADGAAGGGGRPEPTLAQEVLVELDGGESFDPDGDPLKFAWTQISGPRVTLSDPAIAKPSFRTSRVGTYVFQLVVSDGELASEPETVEIQIMPENRPPVLPFTEKLVQGTVGRPLRLDLSDAADPDGDRLIFQWKQLAGPPVAGLDAAAPAPAAGTVSEQPVLAFTPGVAGEYVFMATVSDGQAEVAARFAVTVRPPNRAPRATVKVVATPLAPETPPATPTSTPPAQTPPATATPSPTPSTATQTPAPTTPIPPIPSASTAQTTTPAVQAGSAAPAAGAPSLPDTPPTPLIPVPPANLPPVAAPAPARVSTPPAAAPLAAPSLPVPATTASPAPTATAKPAGNRPPTAQVDAPSRGVVGRPLRMVIQAADPDGDVLTYQWKPVSGPLPLPAIGREAVYEFTPTRAGRYVFEAFLSDGVNPPITAQVAIEVAAEPGGTSSGSVDIPPLSSGQFS